MYVFEEKTNKKKWRIEKQPKSRKILCVKIWKTKVAKEREPLNLK